MNVIAHTDLSCIGNIVCILIHPIIELLIILHQCFWLVISDVFARMSNVFLIVNSNKISVTSISLQVVFLNKMVTEYTIPVQCMDPMETYSLHTGRYIIYKLDTVCEVSMRL